MKFLVKWPSGKITCPILIIAIRVRKKVSRQDRKVSVFVGIFLFKLFLSCQSAGEKIKPKLSLITLYLMKFSCALAFIVPLASLYFVINSLSLSLSLFFSFSYSAPFLFLQLSLFFFTCILIMQTLSYFSFCHVIHVNLLTLLTTRTFRELVHLHISIALTMNQM